MHAKTHACLLTLVYVWDVYVCACMPFACGITNSLEQSSGGKKIHLPFGCCRRSGDPTACPFGSLAVCLTWFFPCLMTILFSIQKAAFNIEECYITFSQVVGKQLNWLCISKICITFSPLHPLSSLVNLLSELLQGLSALKSCQRQCLNVLSIYPAKIRWLMS